MKLTLPLALKSHISKLKNRLKCCLRLSQGKTRIYSARWSLHLFIAFVRERFHNAVKIDILGIFGRVFIVTNLPPLPKIIQGLWPRFHFIGLALTHIPMRKLKTLPSCRLREVGSICEVRATRPVKKTGP